MISHELSERSRRLLAALVREYIATGEPVPSQTLARESGIAVSSATVRNVLAGLEDEGYLHQPHTSAGRVPTDRGYRVFVDLLLESRKPARPTAIVENQLRQHAERSPLIDDLLASVSHMVSRASRHIGFAIAGTDDAVLQRIVRAGNREADVPGRAATPCARRSRAGHRSAHENARRMFQFSLTTRLSKELQQATRPAATGRDEMQAQPSSSAGQLRAEIATVSTCRGIGSAHRCDMPRAPKRQRFLYRPKFDEITWPNTGFFRWRRSPPSDILG